MFVVITKEGGGTEGQRRSRATEAIEFPDGQHAQGGRRTGVRFKDKGFVLG